jgi:hypothetical protein
VGYRDHHKSEGSQGPERDTRKTPGKGAKLPPMGAKRKIIARHADIKPKGRK